MAAAEDEEKDEQEGGGRGEGFREQSALNETAVGASGRAPELCVRARRGGAQIPRNQDVSPHHGGFCLISEGSCATVYRVSHKFSISIALSLC